MNILLLRFKTFIALALITLFSSSVNAVDVIKLLAPQSGYDKKEIHKDEVIKRALDLTVPEYGAYRIEKTKQPAVSGRALKMMQEGDIVNLCIRIANQEWNQNAIPIKIPLRFGVNSYRLLLVNKDSLSKFSEVQTLEDLKELRVGLGRDWAISDVFRANGFTTVESSNFEGTFSMLAHQRFDYIPRGMNEIFEELRIREDKLTNLTVEPTLALELKLSTYAYVSSKYPRIAMRIESGLRLMSDSGELRQIFNKYYLEDIKQADMKNRKIIKIDNPRFVDRELLDNPNYWLSPNS